MKSNVAGRLSLMLALALILCTLSAPPFAASAEELSGACGETLTWRFESDTQTLYIEGNGKMEYESYNSQAPWHSFCGDILAVVIGEGADNIADYAFNGCTSLKSAVIPDGVTQIGEYAFYHCFDLERIAIPDSVSEIADFAFYLCESMTDCTIGGGVASIGEKAFSGCMALPGVCIPESVRTIGEDAFFYCTHMKYILAGAAGRPEGWHDTWNRNLTAVVYWGAAAEVDSQGLVFAKNADGSKAVVDYIGEQDAVAVPEGAAIADRAFSDVCVTLSVTIPESVTEIGEMAFDGADVIFYGYRGSYAEDYAKTHGIHFVTMGLCPDGHTFGEWETVTEANCMPGLEERECTVCGEIERREIPAQSEHDFCEWETVTQASCTEKGSEERECRVCGKIETRSTDALGHAFADEWTVDTPATEEAPGSKSRHCTRCDAKTDVTELKQLAKVADVFDDVVRDKWYYEAVQYAVTNGLFNGVSDTLFKPSGPMNRAMLVSVLYRMEGSPAIGNAANPFTDVPAGKYYTDAVLWASENDIVNGTGEGVFSPTNNITREQMATILLRYTEKKGYDVSVRADLSAYPDGGDTSAFAKDGLAWANAAELITGTKAGEQTLLDPKGSATRAQVATILMRYQNTIE